MIFGMPTCLRTSLRLKSAKYARRADITHALMRHVKPIDKPEITSDPEFMKANSDTVYALYPEKSTI